MSMRSRLKSLWRNLIHPEHVERDLEQELQAYVELAADEYRERGGTAGDAARAARLQLGGVEQVKERVRDARTGAGLETLWHDIRFGVRTLRRSPAFAAAAIASLALGIGANSAVFGLLNAVRLRTLPVRHAQELAEVRLDGPRCCRHTGRNRQVSWPLWNEIVRQQQAFSSLFAFADTRFNLAPHGEVRYVEGLYVSGDFFSTLGASAALGRTLTPQDDKPGCTNAGAVISNALWQGEFGGRPDVLSQSLRLGTTQYPIIGVMPAEFFGVEVGRRFEVALPLCASGFNRPDHWWLAVIGRLKPGTTPEQANAQFAALGPSLLQPVVPPNYEAEQAKQFVTLRFSVRDASNGVSPLRTQYEESLWVLLVIAALVLVTACANVASLSLVRTTAREPELALRFALGASKPRVIRQMLVEGGLISLAGIAAGLFIGKAAHNGILTLLSTPTDPIVLDARFDWRMLSFTALVAGVTTLAFALAPALRAMRRRSLSIGGSRSTHGRGVIAARELLVGVQVALSVVLVSGAMLFILTSRNLLSEDAGFNVQGLFAANVFLPATGNPPETRASTHNTLTSRFAAIPGITGVAHATTPPLGGSAWGTVMRVPSSTGELKAEAIRNQVSAGYFTVMGTSILAGRDFNDADTPSTPKVALVNATFARQFFGEPQPIGRRFFDGNDQFEVVGIVGDSKQYFLREERRSIAYTAASQAAEPPLTVRFMLRSGIGVGPAIDAVRRTLADASPAASVRFAAFEDMAAASAQRERLMARLGGFFGVTALLLAAVGVYGVVAYSAATRSREIGIRLALGARARHVIRAVVGRIALVVAAGCAIGLIITLSTGTMAASFLYGVELDDPKIIALILGVIVASGIGAAAIPARRALHTDPVIALKDM